MKIISLYSGSKGNSTLISAGGANILIDAGKSAARLTAALKEAGLSPADIHGIFITHEHTDHISALEILLKKHKIPVHITEKSAAKLLGRGIESICENLVLHPQLFSVQINGLTVTSFPTPHDSASSVGYRMSFCDTECQKSIGYATDIGYVTDEIMEGLCGCEWVIIEANHDLEMLKCGPYPYDLKKRILSRRGHLCNSDCALLASRLCESGTKNILLAHLSEENNTPELAYDEVASAVGGRVRLEVADQFMTTTLVGESEETC